MTIADLFKLVQGLTVVGALVFALVGGYRKWWVWGYQLEECKQREEWWRQLAMANGTSSKNATQIARTTVEWIDKEKS